MSLQKGLVGHWPLDKESLQSATIFADKTPNENRGTSTNAPVFTTDRMGQADRAMIFNGTSDYVNCGNDASLDLTNEITISAWVKPNNTYTFGILGKSDFNNHFGDYEIHITGGKVRFILNDNSPANMLDSETIDIGEWIHVVATYSTTEQLKKLYINNETPTTQAFTDSINTAYSNVRIGLYYSLNLIFNGSIADVRIYNRALSQTEITALYETYRPKISLGSLMKGLVLDMPLNLSRYNAGNSKFDDLTPYENRGTNTGGDVDTDHTTFIAANSDNVRIPDSESLSSTSAMTAMVWVKGAAQDKKGVLSHYDNGIGQRAFEFITLDISPYDKIKIIISDDGTWDTGHRKNYYSSIVAFDNTWHLIGFSFDAGILKLYVDGVEDTNLTKVTDEAITTIHNSTADIMVGCYLNSDAPTGFFDGDLAKPRMWNRALTDAEWLLEYDKDKGKFL